MKCRADCAACCIAPSISSPIPGMPHGKKAGERCIQLDESNRCKLFNNETRPAVCGDLQASPEMCGVSQQEALAYLTKLQKETDPT